VVRRKFPPANVLQENRAECTAQVANKQPDSAYFNDRAGGQPMWNCQGWTKEGSSEG